MINLIAVFTWFSISTSAKTGTQTKSSPLKTKNPLAIAMALTTWLMDPAPMA